MGGDKRHVIPPMSKHGGDISPPSPPRIYALGLYTDSSSKSEILNKQFKSVFTPPSLVETPKLPGQPFPPIKDLHLAEHSVYKLIDRINTSIFSGPDGIPGKLLQSLANELAPVLRFIFEQSLLTGDLPVDWTRANVAPIFKKGGKLPTCIPYLMATGYGTINYDILFTFF